MGLSWGWDRAYLIIIKMVIKGLQKDIEGGGLSHFDDMLFDNTITDFWCDCVSVLGWKYMW